MAELADALDLGFSPERGIGSNPISRIFKDLRRLAGKASSNPSAQGSAQEQVYSGERWRWKVGCRAAGENNPVMGNVMRYRRRLESWFA